MRITNVRLDWVDTERESEKFGTCANVTVEFEGELQVHNIHVIYGKNGYFVAFPNTGETKMTPKGKRFMDIVHPTNKTLRTKIEKEVLKVYNEATA